jgi:hypothetical protein
VCVCSTRPEPKLRPCTREEPAASVAARYKFTRSVSSPLPPAAAPTPSLITPNQTETKTQTRLLLPIPDVAGGFAGAAPTVSHSRPLPAPSPLPLSYWARGIVVCVRFFASHIPDLAFRWGLPFLLLSPVSGLKFEPVGHSMSCLPNPARYDLIAGCFVRAQRSMASLAPPSSSVAAALTRQQ